MFRLKDVTPNDDEKIYSMDVNDKGAKQFMAMTLPAMWARMQEEPRNYCEIIEDRPCHLFFDLDDGNVREKWHKLETCLNRFFRAHRRDLGVVRYIFLDASKKGKQSAHIIATADKYVLQSPVQGRVFYQRLVDMFQDDVPEIDLAVYTRNRCFRMLGNSKFGQNRPLIGLPWTMENWVSSLVQPVKSMESIDLGLKHVVSAPLRNDMIPPCVEAVLDWAGASDYTWKYDLEWVWGGHLNKGVCQLAGRVHGKNNRYFFYNAPDMFTIGCHHCKRRYNIAVPDELESNVRKFLNQVIKM